MKTFLKFALLAFAAVTLWSCDKDEPTAPSMALTANNIAGSWYLTEFNGQPLAADSYVYINFVRKESRYTMYQNTDSHNPRTLSGRFAIYEDETLGSIIWGTYDYINQDWAHHYIVRDLTEDSMVWIAKDDQNDVSVYKRIASIPEHIVNPAQE